MYIFICNYNPALKKSKESSSTLLYTSVVAIEKGAFGSHTPTTIGGGGEIYRDFNKQDFFNSAIHLRRF